MNLLLDNLLEFHEQVEQQLDSIMVPRHSEPDDVRKITVIVANENDWEFVPIKDEGGYHLGVF